MKKEDKERVIGKVVAINSNKFTIELLTGIENFNINGFDDIHYFAQLNSYIILPYQNYYIIAEVFSVREKDLNVPFSNPTEQFLGKIKSGKYLDVIPIGTLKLKKDSKNDYEFEFGVSVYPALYSDALYIKESELDCIFNVKNHTEIICSKPEKHTDNCICTEVRYKTLPIGKSNIFPDYDIKIDIDSFFGNHSAILGNTGSGKSCTITSLIQGIFKYEKRSAVGSTFVFFDVNGEYKQAFEKLNGTNNDVHISYTSLEDSGKNKFTLPHWFLNFEEWSLLLQASEKTQQPVLRNALNIATLLESPKSSDEIFKIKNHIVATCCIYIRASSESPVSSGHRMKALLSKYADGTELSKSLLEDCSFNFKFGNFASDDDSDFIEALEKVIIEDFSLKDEETKPFDLENLYEYLDIAILYEESFGNKQIRDYCSSMLTRAKSIIERSDYTFLKGVDENLDKYTYTLLGIDINNNTKQKQIIILDLQKAEDEIVELISCVISRIIYEKLKKQKIRNSYPVNLVLEEAHRYVNNKYSLSFKEANKIFERIAKEGRKFGILLTISSQRPSELSETVLSQCSNFIVHRIQNPSDLSHIRQITPHISEVILNHLPSIPRQHALIFGHAVNLPSTFKVNQADPLPYSENNRISESWFRQPNFTVEL